MRRWSFAKGHGTQNDFVILVDREATLQLGEAEVRFLCDRRAGIGGDGVLRAMLAKHADGWPADSTMWFMDYRNADGSIAEMCGNGLRVFARYLLDNGLASGPTIPIVTRAGAREATALPDGRIRVSMGPVRVSGDEVTVSTAGQDYPAVAVDVGNPHAVSFVDDLSRLVLREAPSCAPAGRFPDGVNVEFVRRVGDHHVAMRVYERGSGETRSCGTGTVAAAAAAAVREQVGVPATYRVDVPGGVVEVELTDGESYLTGPAVLVAHGEVTLPDPR